MLHRLSQSPRRVLMTLDAVGGVWRYAMTLGAGLAERGVSTVFVGLGPRPSPAQKAEAERIGELAWLSLPLDWLAADGAALEGVPAALAELAEMHGVDLLHLNLPTQAAGIATERPVIVVSHSCVATWFRVVRSTGLPADWQWQFDLNLAGLQRADVVLVPSRSHGMAVETSYRLPGRTIAVPNAVHPRPARRAKRPVVLAAGRWWDEGKNGATLDAAAASINWPVIMAGAMKGPNGAALGLMHAHGTGELPSAELRGLLEQAAIVASPSVYEPFGLVALEAAHAGAALVLADIPTYRELWSDAAAFVPARDPSAWAEAINSLAADEARQQALAAAACRRAEAFALEAQLDGVLGAYATAMDRPAGRRMVA